MKNLVNKNLDKFLFETSKPKKLSKKRDKDKFKYSSKKSLRSKRASNLDI